MAVYDTSALSTALEFDTTNADSKCVRQITGTDKVIVAWYQSTSIVYVQAFNVNTSTGAVTAIGSPLDIEPSTAGSAQQSITITVIDSSNAIVAWNGSGSDGYLQLISIDGSGNCTTNGSALEYDTARGIYPAGCMMDSTHLLLSWFSTSNLYTQIFTLSTGAGTITAEGSANLVIAVGSQAFDIKKISSTKAVLFYTITGISGTGVVQVIDVNTSTWATTSTGSAYTTQASAALLWGQIAVMDTAGNPIKIVIAFCRTSGTAGNFVTALDISTSTWDVTILGSEIRIDADSPDSSSGGVTVDYVDATHVLVVYYDSGLTDLLALVYTYSSSTGMGSATANTATINSILSKYIATTPFTGISQGFVTAWAGSGNDGYIQALQVTGPTAIKTVNGLAVASVKTINGLAIASVKSINGLQ